MSRAVTVLFALAVVPACRAAGPAPAAPLGHAGGAALPPDAGPRLDGPYPSLLASPPGQAVAERIGDGYDPPPIQILARASGGGFEELGVAELAGSASGSDCAVFVREADRWYIGPSFTCRLFQSDTQLNTTATITVAARTAELIFHFTRDDDDDGTVEFENRVPVRCALGAVGPSCSAQPRYRDMNLDFDEE